MSTLSLERAFLFAPVVHGLPRQHLQVGLVLRRDLQLLFFLKLGGASDHHAVDFLVQLPLLAHALQPHQRVSRVTCDRRATSTTTRQTSAAEAQQSRLDESTDDDDDDSTNEDNNNDDSDSELRGI